MKDHLSQWWVAHLAWLSGLAVAAWPSLREYICSHPVISGGGLGSVILLALLKQSPLTKVVTMLFFCLLLNDAAPAQTPPSAPTPKPPDILENAWNVSVNGGYSNFANAPTNNGFVTGVSFRLSQHLNLRSDVYVLNSPQGLTVAVAGPEYRFSLEHLLKASSYAANASRVEAFFNFEAGDARSSTVVTAKDGTSVVSLSKSKFAWGPGAGFDIKMSDTVTLRPLDVKYLRSSYLNAGGGVYGNQLSFAAGLNLRF